jgi:hypothetical protein
MKRKTRISARVSRTTRDLLQRHVHATGARKDNVVEEALRYHLQAMEALPADVIVRPKLVVTRRSGAAVLNQLKTAESAETLSDLMLDRH